MKTVEATKILKSLGWTIITDEGGDKAASFMLADRTVRIIYGIRNLVGHQDFESILSTSTNDFSAACRAIEEDSSWFTPLVRSRAGLSIRAQEILEKHVQQAADEAIAWAEGQDIAKGLRDLSALPTTSSGARPIWHLAALSVLGDVVTIGAYQSAFKAGDRLGFVTYITSGHIDRAMRFAQYRISDCHRS